MEGSEVPARRAGSAIAQPHALRQPEGVTTAPRAGFRLLPHVADLIVEAWGPSRSTCLEAAVRGLVAAFADTTGAVPDARTPVEFAGVDDDELLVSVLEEVIFVVDAEGRVPVEVELHDEGDTVRGVFATVAVDQVVGTGAIPKGVSRSELALGRHDGQWRGHAVIDV